MREEAIPEIVEAAAEIEIIGVSLPLRSRFTATWAPVCWSRLMKSVSATS